MELRLMSPVGEPPIDRRPRTLMRRPSRRPAWSAFIAFGLTSVGLGLLPWMIYLATSLPASSTAYHWAAAWVGLDAMEAIGLIGTGVLTYRRDARYCLASTATAALLLVDAWFDVTTAPPGSGALASLLMAALAEVPASAVCLGLAAGGLRRLVRGDWQAGTVPAATVPAATVPAATGRPLLAGLRCPSRRGSGRGGRCRPRHSR